MARWISEVPILKAAYDTVLLDASSAVRAVRTGSGLAIETTAGGAYMLELVDGLHPLDLNAADDRFRPAE